MIKTISLLSLFLTLTAFADDSASTGVQYGVGVSKSAGDGGATSTKFIALERQHNLLGDFLISKYEGGGWFDSNTDLGHKSSGFIGYSVGFQTIASGGFYAKALTGPSLITTEDTLLGGPFQFHEDFGMGVKGTNDVSIGFNYSHFSSAGIYKVNQGRDFLTFNVILPF